jgi:hypothetical protein
MTEPIVTLDEIATAKKICAKLVVRDGSKFLPIFERLEREYERAEEREDTIARARGLADDEGRE